jgi:hypothetical protein
MKIPIFALVLAVCLVVPSPAQTAPDGSTPDTGAATPVVPALPRNIMPWSTNHKPNPTNPPVEIAGLIDKFFKGLEAGNYADSYENFLVGTRLGTQKDKMSAMIARTEDGFGIYGKMHDYEIYDNFSIGSNVLILTYLARHDIQPLRWRFIFYRADKSWRLINMGFDDFLLDMLD